MVNTLFLQSSTPDPYEIYGQMLETQPVYWDELNQLWAVYSYADCRYLLNNELAEIPCQSKAHREIMNEYTQTILDNLVRLRNPPTHPVVKPLVLHLFERLKRVEVGEVIEPLMGTPGRAVTFDWVTAVCKKLPAVAILKGFAFPEGEAELILDKLESLTKLMVPHKTAQLLEEINTATEVVYPMVERHLNGTEPLSSLIKDQTNRATGPQEVLAMLISNLIGLLIQSFEAGRGLLSNTLLQQLKPGQQGSAQGRDKTYFRKSVTETVRFDPPIHNTRRTLVKDVVLEGRELKAGETVLIVLAAANRDARQFEQPDRYDIHRSNNEAHLTFGAGPHLCPAKRYAIDLAVETLTYLFEKYSGLRLLDEEIDYEPLVNARLPKKMMITLSN